MLAGAEQKLYRLLSRSSHLPQPYVVSYRSFCLLGCLKLSNSSKNAFLEFCTTKKSILKW